MYVVMDFGVFVCPVCAGIHREFSHKVKGISMCNFNDSEIDNLTKNGNAVSVLKTNLELRTNVKNYWLNGLLHLTLCHPSPTPGSTRNSSERSIRREDSQFKTAKTAMTRTSLAKRKRRTRRPKGKRRLSHLKMKQRNQSRRKRLSNQRRQKNL